MTPFGVISYILTLQGEPGSTPSVSERCHAMASPSLSGSEAMSTRPLTEALSFRFRTTAPLPLTRMYSGSKPLSTSMARRLLGRSRICPTLDWMS